MPFGLPARDEANWDTKLNDSINAVKATADAAQPAATLDASVTAVDANAASALRVQQDARLSATYAPLGFSVAPESYGAVGDGVTDDTAAIQAAIAAVAALSTTGGAVVLTQKYLITEVTITAPYIRLTGGGTIAEGTVKIGTDGTGSPYDRLHTRIDNLHFVRATASSTVNAITAARTYGIAVDDVSFENYNAAFYVRSQSFIGAETHHTARVRLSRLRTKDCNFVLRTTAYTSGGGLLACADFLLTECQELAVLDSHVYCEGIDGLTVSNNFMFMPGYNTSHASKRWNIRVDGGANLAICDNQLFEAGLEAVYISKFQGATLDGNLIMYPGQRLRSDGIRLTGGDTAADEYVFFTANSNKIIWPTRHAISVEGTTGHGVIDHNVIRSPGASGRYYGAEGAAAVADYISTEATTKNIIVGDSNEFSTGSGTPRVHVQGTLSNPRGGAGQAVFVPGTQTPFYNDGAWVTLDFATAGLPFGNRRMTAGGQNSELSYYVDLKPGTYTFDLWHHAGADRGIYTVRLDGTSIGTIDGYAAATAGAQGSITGVVVPVGGRVLVNLKMATKNASSSAYRGALSGFGFTRTGA